MLSPEKENPATGRVLRRPAPNGTFLRVPPKVYGPVPSAPSAKMSRLIDIVVVEVAELGLNAFASRAP